MLYYEAIVPLLLMLGLISILAAAYSAHSSETHRTLCLGPKWSGSDPERYNLAKYLGSFVRLSIGAI